jgi:hypothetical protein
VQEAYHHHLAASQSDHQSQTPRKTAADQLTVQKGVPLDENKEHSSGTWQQ